MGACRPPAREAAARIRRGAKQNSFFRGCAVTLEKEEKQISIHSARLATRHDARQLAVRELAAN